MPTQFFIPNLGTLLILAEPWTFRLYFESRNVTMLAAVMPTYIKSYWAGADESSFEDNQIPDCVKYERAMSEQELANAYKSYAATDKNDKPYVEVTLPEGTQLSVDRIYVKRGSESFNSVTFRTTKICPEKQLRSKRFWVKLKDANTIIANMIG